MGKRQNTPYGQRSDLDKIKSQWVKLSGLHGREEWSAAVVRAATAAEIAVNFAIREEFKRRNSQLECSVIDTFLKNANGLKGKLDRLLLTLLKQHPDHREVKDLSRRAYKINEKRNSIVHSGDFCDQAPASELIEECRIFVHGIVRLYEPGFTLPTNHSAEAEG